MPLEVATYLSQLDETWPTGGDRQDRGDDHIRLIKDVLKNTFAGPSGNGYDKAITVSADLLNSLQTILDNLAQSIKNVYPINSIVIRADNVNPASVYPGTTWTLITGDHAIFLGNGSNGGSTTGNNSVDVPLPIHSHTVTISNGGEHGHNVTMRARNDFLTGSVEMSGGNAAAEHHTYNNYGPVTTRNGLHTHSNTVSSAGVSSAKIDVRGSRIFINVWKRVS